MLNRITISKTTKYLLVLLLISAFSVSCSRDKKESKAKKLIKTTGKFDLSNSLASNIPASSFGFLQWDLSHAAYKKQQNSAWKGSNEQYLKSILESSKDDGDLINALKKIDIDIKNVDTYQSIFSQGVFFVGPGNGDEPIAGGFLFESNSNFDLAGKAQALKSELHSSDDMKISDLELDSGISGFQVTAKNGSSSASSNANRAGAENKGYFAWKGQRGVFSSDEKLISPLLNPTDSAQSLVSSQVFKDSVKNLPGNKVRFAEGFFNLESASKHFTSVSNSPKARMNFEKFPFQAASFASSMTEGPENNLRFLLDKEDKEQWLSLLNASPSETVLSSVSKKPLLFVSFDGKSIASLKDRALSTLGDKAQPVRERLKFLDGFKRVGLSANLAPVGQALLPVPDLQITIDTQDVPSVKQSIKSFAKEASQGSGMQWMEKEVDGKKIDFMMSPFGLGVFLATENNLLVAASTEAQLMKALANLKNGKEDKAGFTQEMSSRAKDTLESSKTISNFYLDFEQVGSLMENMGGLLSMYAPQSKEAQKLLEPSKIEAIKKMGNLLGSVISNDDAVEVNSFYQAATNKSKK